jgi:hypothetical protein
VRPGRAPSTATTRGRVVALVVSVILALAFAIAHGQSTPQVGPGPQPADSLSDAFGGNPDNYDPSVPAVPNDVTTTDDPDSNPVDPATTPAYQPPPPPTAPPDLIASAQVGDCFFDTGSNGTANLVSTGCTTGAFQVVQINNGTTDLNSCNNVTGSDESVASSTDLRVLCLSYQSSGGTAYHAQQDDCVYGASSGGPWSVESCQTGNFKVLAAYKGTTDTSKCQSWPLYDENWHSTVPDNSGLDVLLCLAMNYPDALGNATLNECLVMSGPSNAPVFTNVDSCSASNVAVSGRTSTYDDPGFCGSDASVWWRPTGFPSLGYTVCWRWLR